MLGMTAKTYSFHIVQSTANLIIRFKSHNQAIKNDCAMRSNLPKSYRVAVFKEKGQPLTIEERELKLPSDGEVEMFSIIHDLSSPVHRF